MLRRIYMLFPQRKFVEQAVQDLMTLGVPHRNLHTIAAENVDISGLPEATVGQLSGTAEKLEKVFWSANLALFFIAMLVLVAALLTSNGAVAIVSLAVMLVTFWAGNYFASSVPHAHLSECRNAIRHGEILLLVDVPRWRVHRVEQMLKLRHPEMDLGGVTWTLQGL